MQTVQYLLSRAICDERDKESSRFDLACGAHECLRSTLRGMQMCLGLRQATTPRSTNEAGSSRRLSSARRTSYSARARARARRNARACGRSTNLWLITRPAETRVSGVYLHGENFISKNIMYSCNRGPCKVRKHFLLCFSHNSRSI